MIMIGYRCIKDVVCADLLVIYREERLPLPSGSDGTFKLSDLIGVMKMLTADPGDFIKVEEVVEAFCSKHKVWLEEEAVLAAWARLEANGWVRVKNRAAALV